MRHWPLSTVGVAISLLLAGCATMTDVMKGYVGKSLQEAVISYGPPANAFDMPDGSRAFQWVATSNYVMPVNAYQSGSVTGYGNMAQWSQNTQITGGQVITGQCMYTMFARWDSKANAWVFTSFKKPTWACDS